MDSETIADLLEVIAEEPGKNNKIDLLKEFMEDEDFTKVLKLSCDPLVNYGILNVELPNIFGEDNFNDSTFTMLRQLAERQLSGDTARGLILMEFERLNESSAILLSRILKKDLRAGFTAKSVNKAIKHTIRLMPYMRCSTLKEVNLDKLNWKKGVYSQIKADGMFCNINVLDTVEVLTRPGQVFPMSFLNLKNTLLSGFQYHGEITIYDKDRGMLSRKEGNGILNSLLKVGKLGDRYKLKFTLWDMIGLDFVNGIKNTEDKYAVRFTNLKMILRGTSPDISLTDNKILHSVEEAEEDFDDAIIYGEEGLILKDPDAEWKNGTSRMQVKMKAEKECDLKIVSIQPGKGKYTGTTGSVACISEDMKLAVSVSGFTDDERNEIWLHPDDWLMNIISVKYNEIIKSKEQTAPYSLFLPRFIEKREDKITANTLEEILNI